MVRRRSIGLVIIAAGLLLVAALAVLMFGSSIAPRAAPVAPTQQSAAEPQSTPPSPPTMGGDVNAAAPSAKELGELEAAMASSKLSELGPYLPISSGQSAETGFASRLAVMRLTVDYSSLRQIETGLWLVAATDSTGQEWSIGLIRTDGQLRMFSAEEAAG